MISTGDPERDAELAKDFQSNKKSSGNDPDETRGTEAQATAAKTLRMAGDEEEAEEVSANFQAWVHKLNGLGDKDDARTEIRMRGTMSLPEAIYLLRNINYEEIAETLRKKLKKLGEEV